MQLQVYCHGVFSPMCMYMYMWSVSVFGVFFCGICLCCDLHLCSRHSVVLIGDFEFCMWGISLFGRLMDSW